MLAIVVFVSVWYFGFDCWVWNYGFLVAVMMVKLIFFLCCLSLSFFLIRMDTTLGVFLGLVWKLCLGSSEKMLHLWVWVIEQNATLFFFWSDDGFYVNPLVFSLFEYYIKSCTSSAMVILNRYHADPLCHFS